MPTLLMLLLTACGDHKDSRFADSNTKPQPAPDSWGKQQFVGNCLQCHALNKDRTGPMLAGVWGRWNNDTAKVVAFIKNSQQVIAQDGPKSYSGQLFEKWYKTTMPAFGGLSDSDIKQILNYANAGVE